MNEDVIIRTAESKDAARLAALEEICFSTPWSETALRKEIEENTIAKYIVAEKDGRIVGYAGIWCIIDEGHIMNVAVDPAYRNRQTATAMMRELIRLMEIAGIKRFTLEVRKSNEAARGLYRKFGFRETEIRAEYYEDNKEDAIIMWRGKLVY